MSGWFIYAVLSAIMAALVSIFGKIGLQGIDSNTATAVRAVIMAIFLAGVVVVEGKLGQIPAVVGNKKAFAFILFSGVAGALSWMFYFLALKQGNVAQVGPVDKLSVVIAVLLGVLFLGEKISAVNWIGVILIAAGVVLTAWK